MEAGRAKTLTTMSMGLMFTAGIVKSTVVDDRFPPVSFFIGVGFASVGLAMAADLAPEVAGSLALLIMTVVVLEEIGPVLRARQFNRLFNQNGTLR